MTSKSPAARSPNRDGGGIFDGVSKSPARLRFRDVGDTGLSDLDVFSKPPARSNGSMRRSLIGEGVLDGFKGASKSPARSRTGDVNGSGSSDLDAVGISPARSIHGTDWRSPMRDVVDGYDGVSKSPARWIDEDAWELNGSSGPFRRWRASAEEEASTDLESNFRRIKFSSRSDQIGTVQNSEYAGNHGRPLEAPVGDLFDHGLKREHGDMKFRSGQVGGFARSEETVGQRVAEGNGLQVIQECAEAVGECRRMSKYLDEGPSNLHSDSFHGNGQLRQTFRNPRGSASAQNLELERAELLRRFAEINEQLSSTVDVTSGKKISCTEPDIYNQKEIFRPRREAMHSSYGDKNNKRHPYANNGHGLTPFRIGRNMEGINDVYCPLRSAAYDILIPDDLYVPQIPTKTPIHGLCHYSQRSALEYVPMQSMDFDQDASHSRGKCFNNSMSRCSYCYINNRQAHLQAPAAAFGHVRAPSGLYDPICGDPNGYHAQGPNPGMANFSAGDLPQLIRSGNPNSITGGFGHLHRRRIQISNLNKRTCLPIAGGAPFILCYNCFQLLELPRKLRATKKSHHGLHCGACSAMIELLIENKRSVVSGPLQSQPDAAASDNGPSEMLISNGSAAVNNMKVKSNDFHSNGDTFVPVGADPELMSEERRINSGEAGKTQGLSTSSSSFSKEESNQDTSVVQIDAANPAKMPIKINLVPPPPGSALREFFNYSTVFAFRSEVGNNRTCTEQENKVVEKETFNQNSAATAAVATEMEINSYEFSKTSLSQELEEVSREEERVARSEGGESSFGASESGITYLTDYTHHESGQKTGVYVNGQPIQHHDVKEAEKLAGPISPGNYWYDSQAGFWGVMGNRCLGIIPPSIHEFSFPMLVNCAGGNTAVIVNGRELHTRDLELLAARGFPTTMYKSYIVDMSGKVIDEDTGKLVVKLRRLAPTVGKAGRGFGMKVPKKL